MNSKPISPDDPRITAHALGELQGAERAAFESELQTNPAARAMVDEVRIMAARMTAAFALEAAEETEDLLPESDSSQARDVSQSKRRPFVWMLAAAAGIAASLAVLVSRNRPEPKLQPVLSIAGGGEDQVVTLAPFDVRPGDEHGFSPLKRLEAMRPRTDRRDAASAVSVDAPPMIANNDFFVETSLIPGRHRSQDWMLGSPKLPKPTRNTWGVEGRSANLGVPRSQPVFDTGFLAQRPIVQTAPRSALALPPAAVTLSASSLAVTGDGSGIVTLAPFDVRPVDGNGYMSSSTMSGTRLRTNLRDVASSVTIVPRPPMIVPFLQGASRVILFRALPFSANHSGSTAGPILQSNDLERDSMLLDSAAADKITAILGKTAVHFPNRSAVHPEAFLPEYRIVWHFDKGDQSHDREVLICLECHEWRMTDSSSQLRGNLSDADCAALRAVLLTGSPSPAQPSSIP